MREILADPKKFDYEHIPDPLEPDYDGGRLVAIIYTTGKPLIWSFARGGRSLRMLQSNESFEDDPSLCPR